MATFQVTGSHGELIVDADSGEIIERSDVSAYPEVARFDMNEWRATYPDETPENASPIDILDLACTLTTGERCAADAYWREEFKHMRGLTLTPGAAAIIQPKAEG